MQTLTQPIRAVLTEGIARLSAASVPSAPLSAELLLMHALGRDRTWLYTHSDEAIDAAQCEKYFALIARRAAGEPTQYIIGKQEFWGLEFEVTPAVLIPRPETEHIIEVALDRLAAKRSAPLCIADVGTGSGCIAVALAKEFPRAEIIASDLSAAALEIAKRNALRHEVASRIEFVEADLLSALFSESHVSRRSPPGTRHFFRHSQTLDLIVSNPPYVARNDEEALQREIREHEPHVALFGGETGVEIYGRLVEQAEALLAPGGYLIVEVGYGAADSVRAILDSRAAWKNIAVTNDLAGIPRVLAAQRA